MKKILLLSVLGLFFTQHIFSQTKTWAGTTTDWHTAANWNPVGVPTAANDVVINTATNSPVISSNVSAKTIAISVSGASLTVNSGATLTVSNNAGTAIQISYGKLTNNGTIVVSNTNPTEVSQEAAILLTFNAIVDNTGTITVNGNVNYGIRMAAATINNKNGALITSNGKEVIRFGDGNAILNNNTGATLKGTSPATAITIIPGTINNNGLIDIVGHLEAYNNGSRIFNEPCGTIKVDGSYFNQSNARSDNDGFIQVEGDLVNAGSFSNGGVIVAYSYPTLNSTGILVRHNATNSTIFTASSSTLSAVQGIFLDAAATISAGTFTASNKTFYPGSFGGGTYTLYAKISFGACTFIVPFSYLRDPTRRYVKTTASGTGDGSSWANASNDIQAMINASQGSDSVWIAAGVYVPLYDGAGNSNPSNIRHKIFYMKSGVRIFGGFAGTETTFNQRNFKTNKTIFSGDADNNDTNTDGNFISENYTDIQGNNSYHILGIIGCDKRTLVDGITFTGGKSGQSGDPSQPVGSGSLSSVFGPAISMQASFPTISNCTFIGNEGFYGSTYHNNVNGTDTVRINNSYYLNNRASYAGAMFIHRGHTIVNNVVMFNNSANYGGAINISSNMQSDRLIQFTNTTIVNNYSTYQKSFYISAGNVKLINSIIWNEIPYTGGNISKNGGTLVSSYSILQNSSPGGTWNDNYGTNSGNNYDADPLFNNITDVDGADNTLFTTDDGLSLSSCSPGLNTGTNTDVFTKDISNSPRPYSSGITDIGAYERQSAATITNSPTNVSVNKTVVCSGNTVILSAQCNAGTITWYNQATGGTALGTGNNFSQSPTNNITYYSTCEIGNCKSQRVETPAIIISTISSNVNLTASISGIAIHASSNTIVAINKILSTANAQYLANNSISLNAGFEASPGAVFVAKATPISACN